jgi:hypothetical protein
MDQCHASLSRPSGTLPHQKLGEGVNALNMNLTKATFA